jgi:O6-methylguanine-DNA--protein-cysteine methyltransferase
MHSIYYEEVSTPLGNMQVGISEAGIAMFEFPIEDRITHDKQKFSELFDEVPSPSKGVLNRLRTQMSEYFDGRRTSFDLPLDLIGTDFQCEV